ncbi:RNA methyltransferase [Bifidobacterium sp. SMB2]|uniref:RNA methyltransferase n=1 Tax=Bifidobacterium saimiriisciurei TaxID=2661627 RepID=A0ABX0C8V4_9BIFI|nr:MULTISPECIES: RNA methyltransferase [Bifidobacterium]NEG95704.1 RNA methyltransferase [Bifidobacterium sp. SMB2]NEH11131.1 RNA methyltransferase [Bifidobacterium saimiriisciurei]
MPLTQGTMTNPNADRVRRIAELTRAKTRRKVGRMLVEAPQAVREAVTFHPERVEDVYIAIDEDGNTVSARAAEIAAYIMGHKDECGGIYVHYVTQRVMDAISGDAQGIAAVASTKGMAGRLADFAAGGDNDVDGRRGPLTIAAFWQVRDPGNAGTVIRTADAAGADAVVFVDDCVDPLGPKVVRSTAGSLFHIPVLRASVDELFAWNTDHNASVLAADVRGTGDLKPVPLPELLAAEPKDDAHTSRSILFGNEARGLDDDILERCDGIVSIPIYGKAESLNLATSAAVLLYSLAMSSHVGKM